MKSNMCLSVEFLAGTSLEDCLEEARNKAIKFELAYVYFDFNGVSFSVRANGNIQEAMKKYDQMQNTKSKVPHVLC